MSTAARSDSGHGAALAFISPEALEEIAGNVPEDKPKPANGRHYGPPCPECDKDGQD